MALRADRLPVRGVAIAVRLAWGGLLLLTPGLLLRPVGPITSPAEVALRVLGARHVAQAAVTVRIPTPGVFAAGAAVDGLHAITALALAADRRQRPAALVDAAVATGWALLGAVVARHRGEP